MVDQVYPQSHTVDEAKLVATHQKHSLRIFDEYPVVTAVDVNYRHVKGKQTKERCIVIWVREKKPKDVLPKNEVLPENLDGCPVDVVEGEVKLLEGEWPTEEKADLISDDNKSLKRPTSSKDKKLFNRRFGHEHLKRPTSYEDDHSFLCGSGGTLLEHFEFRDFRSARGLRGGHSISVDRADTSTGTLGYFVENNEDIGILTCAHLLKGMGTKVASPSLHDGGTRFDYIGTTECMLVTNEKYEDSEIKMYAGVDCAFVSLSDPHDLEIMMRYDKTVIRGTANAKLGEDYRFCGHATKNILNSSGTIESIHFDSRVHGKILQRQILLSNPTSRGDSGSLLYNNNKEAIGLVFSAAQLEETKTWHGVASPIGPVLQVLGVRIAERGV